MSRIVFRRFIMVSVFLAVLTGCPLPYDFSGEGAGSLAGPDPSSPNITAPVQINYDPQDGLDGEMSVTLRTDTENATIYYTTDGIALNDLGSANKISGSVGDFTLVADTGPDTWTIYAVAIGPGLLPSPVASAMVTVNPPTRTLPDEVLTHLYMNIPWGADDILRAPLNNLSIVEIFVDGVGPGLDPAGLAFDYAQRRLFWLELTVDGVRSASVGTDPPIIDQWPANMNFPQAIAVDPDSNTVYWIGQSPNALYRSDYDGGNTTLLGSPYTGPLDLAFDRFADVIIGSDNNTNSLYRIQPDGSAAALYSGGNARGIDIDQSTGRIYFVTGGGFVYSIAEDGTDLRFVASSGGVGRAIVVDPYNGYVYWSIGNSNNGTVYRAPLDRSSEPIPVITGLPGVPGDMVLGTD